MKEKCSQGKENNIGGSARPHFLKSIWEGKLYRNVEGTDGASRE